ncbi:MAG: hypothetical protein ACI4PW_08180, partial [Alphaproteobacteria bacterium]
LCIAKNVTDGLADGGGTRRAKYPCLDVYALNETHMPQSPPFFASQKNDHGLEEHDLRIPP